MNRIILVAVACLALSSCSYGSPASQPAPSNSTATTKAAAAPASKPVKRDWVSELASIGYQRGTDGGHWLDDRMKKDAKPFCSASLTASGDRALTGMYDQTEFEAAIIAQTLLAKDPDIELGYFFKVLERYCPARTDAFDAVIKLHPELGTPRGRA